jgi:hypothetical protein
LTRKFGELFEKFLIPEISRANMKHVNAGFFLRAHSALFQTLLHLWERFTPLPPNPEKLFVKNL